MSTDTKERMLVATPLDGGNARAELRIVRGSTLDQRTEVHDNKTSEKTLQQQLEDKLKELQIGESISGKELGRLIGKSEVSLAVSKIKRVNETTFEVTRTLTGKLLINDSPAKIEKTTIKIDGEMESVYRIQINLKNLAIKQGLPPDFYIYNNRMYFYENGKLYHYEETTK